MHQEIHHQEVHHQEMQQEFHQHIYASRYNMVAVILCHLADLLQVYQHNLRRATEGHSGLVICKAQGAMHIVQIRTKIQVVHKKCQAPHRTFVFYMSILFPTAPNKFDFSRRQTGSRSTPQRNMIPMKTILLKECVPSAWESWAKKQKAQMALGPGT